MSFQRAREEEIQRRISGPLVHITIPVLLNSFRAAQKNNDGNLSLYSFRIISSSDKRHAEENGESVTPATKSLRKQALHVTGPAFLQLHPHLGMTAEKAVFSQNWNCRSVQTTSVKLQFFPVPAQRLLLIFSEQ